MIVRTVLVLTDYKLRQRFVTSKSPVVNVNTSTFNLKDSVIFATQRVDLFCRICTVQNDYFPLQTLPVKLSNGKKKIVFTVRGKPKFDT